MAVSVLTLWLIFVLTILVISVILSLPDMMMRHQCLIAVFFATVVAAVVVSFVPVEVSTPVDEMSYNSLIVIAYLLPIILIIVIAASGMHHNYTSRDSSNNSQGSVDAKVSCERGDDGEPENCRLDKMTMRKGNDKVRVSFR